VTSWVSQTTSTGHGERTQMLVIPGSPDTRRAKRQKVSTDHLRAGRPIISRARAKACNELAMLWRNTSDRDGRVTNWLSRWQVLFRTGMPKNLSRGSEKLSDRVGIFTYAHSACSISTCFGRHAQAMAGPCQVS
jgi:hypothetical protein